MSFVTKQKRNDMNVFQKKEPKQNKQYYQKKTNNTKILYQKSVSYSFSDNDMRQHTKKRPIAKISHR